MCYSVYSFFYLPYTRFSLLLYKIFCHVQRHSHVFVHTSPIKGLSVGNNPIDFSVGLELSLDLLARYRQSGLLHAEIQRVPGIRGVCHAWISLVQGRVTFCYIESSTGQRYQADRAALLQMDAERGPFGWSLMVQPSPEVSPQSSQMSPSSNGFPMLPAPTGVVQTKAIPRQIAPFDLAQFVSVPNRERVVLRLVFTMIDGRRTIEEIKSKLSLSSDVIEWALQSLVTMKIITVEQHPM